MNHIADWDSNFQNVTRTYDVRVVASQSDDEIAAAVAASAHIEGKPKEVYREGDDLEVLYDHRTLHVDLPSGRVVDEQQKPRFFLRVANWLHLNRGKKAWKYFADAYALGLLLLATSGLFMIPGKKGLIGRGIVFVTIGAAIPILYVTLSKGP
ncbi:MAG TPA: PepSY-associated TM helix domain-containing protein [Polyangiaceae bacterium]